MEEIDFAIPTLIFPWKMQWSEFDLKKMAQHVHIEMA